MARTYKKNGNGEGSVFRRKDGYWVAQYAVNCNGTIKYRQKYGKTQKGAIQKRDETRAGRNLASPSRQFAPAWANTSTDGS